MVNYNTKYNIGDRFGKLVIIDRFRHPRDNHGVFLVRCDCGTEFTINQQPLVKKSKKYIKSCIRCRFSNCNMNFNDVYRTYVQHAKIRNLEWTINKEQFLEITQQNCYYCGVAPYQVRDWGVYSQPFIYNGLDRVNNKLGYILKNIVLCCGYCNQMKMDETYDRFLDHIIRIYNNRCIIKENRNEK